MRKDSEFLPASVSDERDPVRFSHFHGKSINPGPRNYHGYAQSKGFLQHVRADSPGGQKNAGGWEVWLEQAFAGKLIEGVMPANVFHLSDDALSIAQRGGMHAAGQAVQALGSQEIFHERPDLFCREGRPLGCRLRLIVLDDRGNSTGAA